MKARIKDKIKNIPIFEGSFEKLEAQSSKYPTGSVVRIESTGQAYVKGYDEKWVEINDSYEGTLGNLYDMNKQIIQQLPNATEEDIMFSKDLVQTFIESRQNKYFMLLCNDRNYYTLFHINDQSDEPLSEILFNECIPNFANLKCVNETEDKGAIEIWTEADGEIYVMYFFPYDEGVIECCQ